MTPGRRFRSAAAWTIGGSLAATVAFAGGASLSWRHVVMQTLENMLFSGPCVALCVFGLPIAVPAAHRRLRAPFDWVAILAALVAFGIAGSLVGGAVAVAFGFIQSTAPFFTWYPDSMKVAVYFTVIFGLSGTIIEQLRSRLASTTVALRTKERDEAEARRLAAEAQLASLEARVDPHFLFNTLNSIAALVRGQPADGERVIEQLAALMRSSLDRRASLVPIEDELSIVRSYLEIERVRFGDRLQFTITPLDDGPSSPLAARVPLVPRLALQTLVENSVKFAVAPSRTGAAIHVRVASRGGRLQLGVEDNGPGFDAATLPDGHGLHLLKARLQGAFGNRASLAVDSQPGRTVVTLDLPFETLPPPPAATAPTVPTEPPAC